MQKTAGVRRVEIVICHRNVTRHVSRKRFDIDATSFVLLNLCPLDSIASSPQETCPSPSFRLLKQLPNPESSSNSAQYMMSPGLRRVKEKDYSSSMTCGANLPVL